MSMDRSPSQLERVPRVGMDLLTLGNLSLDPKLRVRVRAACGLARAPFTDEVIWDVVAGATVITQDEITDDHIIDVVSNTPQEATDGN